MRVNTRYRNSISKCTRASPLLTQLHWLPIAQRIEYKVSSMWYDVVSETALPYLSDLSHLYIPSRSVRSSGAIRTFQIPKRKEKKREKNPRAIKAPFPVWALSHGINSHTLYAMLQQNPSSKLNSKPHYSSQPMDQTPKFHCFVRACMRACVRACV